MGQKYVIAGSGAVGASIGGFLAKNGEDVTFLARGAHLEAMREKGLTLKGGSKGDFTVKPVRAMTMGEYADTPDIVFVCVKWYSLDDVTAMLKRVAAPKTVVIPVLNIYGTGEKLQEELEAPVVTDGCIYVAAHISAPGEITRDGDILRVVYGLRPGQRSGEDTLEKLSKAEADMMAAGITPVYTDKVKRDTFKKFAYTSPIAGAGEYFHAASGAFQKPGKERDTFIAMMRELEALADAMDLEMDIDIVETNLAILDDLKPDFLASMQRDIANGKPSEISGLVYAVEDMASKYGVDMPVYGRIISELKNRGLR